MGERVSFNLLSLTRATSSPMSVSSPPSSIDTWYLLFRGRKEGGREGGRERGVGE